MTDAKHVAETLDTAYTVDLLKSTTTDQLAPLDQSLCHLRNLIDRDLSLQKSLKARVAKLLDDTEMAQRIFDTMMKSGGPGSVGVSQRAFNHPNDYLWRWFSDLSVQLSEQFKHCMQSLEDLERNLEGQGKQQDGNQIVTVVKVLYEAFVQECSRVAKLHDQVEENKTSFIKWRRAVLGDTRDYLDDYGGRRVDGGYSEVAKRIATPATTSVVKE